MGKSSAPPAPDYTSAANATAAGNIDYARMTTRANRPNMYTPFGSQTWTQGDPTRTFNQARFDKAVSDFQGSPAHFLSQVPAEQGGGGGATDIGPRREDDAYWDVTPSDNWTSTVTLDPELQSIFDKGTGLQNNLLDQASQNMQTPFSLDGLPQSPEVYDPDKTSSRAYDLIMERLAPTMQRDRDAMHTRLSNMGLTMGSEAYGGDVNLFNQKENDVRLGAMVNAMDLGQRQQAQQFSQGQSSRADAIRELIMKRTQPLNELNAVRTGTQVNMPQFGNVPTQGQVQGPNLTNAALNQYQGSINSFNADQAQQAQSQGAIASIAAAMILSDIRVKHSIKKLGTLSSGLGVYSYFNMVRGAPEIGLIAQEVALLKPHAVKSIGGLLHVNYAAAME